MANPEHVEILKQGAEAWNVWRKEHPKVSPQLEDIDFSNHSLLGINFRSAHLSRASFRGADVRNTSFQFSNLAEANLYEANCEGANFHNAKLAGADLRGISLRGSTLVEVNLIGLRMSQANLTGANLIRANLQGTNLEKSRLVDANLRGTNLKKVNFTGATVGWTAFNDVDLSETIGLNLVKHRGPSSIGLDTIFQSHGAIPEVFLKGAGVPNALITYPKSLIGSAIEYYSLFLSYSTKDQDFADRLYADLQAKGVRCWFAPHDIQGGRKIHEQIDEAIRLHDKLLLILSPHSMSSEWVKTEIAKARKHEVRDQARVLFPISLAPFDAIRDWEAFDADTGKDSAREIREYFRFYWGLPG